MSLISDLSTARTQLLSDTAIIQAIVNGPESGAGSLVPLPGGGSIRTLARVRLEAATGLALPMTGAIARTPEARAADRPALLDWTSGLVTGDGAGGGTDITSMLQAAIDSFGAAGGELYVPRLGTNIYRLGGVVQLKDRVRVHVAKGVKFDVLGGGGIEAIGTGLGTGINLAVAAGVGDKSLTLASAFGAAGTKGELLVWGQRLGMSLDDADAAGKYWLGFPTGATDGVYLAELKPYTVNATPTIVDLGSPLIFPDYLTTDAGEESALARARTTVHPVSWCEAPEWHGGEFINCHDETDAILYFKWCRAPVISDVSFDFGTSGGHAIITQHCYREQVDRPRTHHDPSFDDPAAANNSYRILSGWKATWVKPYDEHGSQGVDCSWVDRTWPSMDIDIHDPHSVNNALDGLTTHSGAWNVRVFDLRAEGCLRGASSRARHVTFFNPKISGGNPNDPNSGGIRFYASSLGSRVVGGEIRDVYDGITSFGTEGGSIGLFPRNHDFRDVAFSNWGRWAVNVDTGGLRQTTESLAVGIRGCRFLDGQPGSLGAVNVDGYANATIVERGFFSRLGGGSQVGVNITDNNADCIIRDNEFVDIGDTATGILTSALSASLFNTWASARHVLEKNRFKGAIGRRTVLDGSVCDQLVSGPSNGNLLRNPAMLIAKRGPSMTGVGANSDYAALDGWRFTTYGSAPARWTVSQEAAGGVSGGEMWMKVLCATADTTVASGVAQVLRQAVEGRCARSLLGADNRFAGAVLSMEVMIHKDAASSITFPVKLSLIVRTFDGTGRQYIGTVTIRSADVWRRVAIAIPADATAQIDNDDGAGLYAGLALYSEAAVASPAVWVNASSTTLRAAPSPNLADATGNYIGITRIKLEPGEVETPFRYDAFEDSYRCEDYLVALDAAGATSAEVAAAYRGAESATVAKVVVPTHLRPGVTPTLTATASEWTVSDGVSTTQLSALAVDTGSRVGRHTVLTATVASGLTQYRPYSLRENGSNNGKILLDRELA